MTHPTYIHADAILDAARALGRRTGRTGKGDGMTQIYSVTFRVATIQRLDEQGENALAESVINSVKAQGFAFWMPELSKEMIVIRHEKGRDEVRR